MIFPMSKVHVLLYGIICFFNVFFLSSVNAETDSFTQKDRELLIRFEERLNQMNKRFEQVDKRFEELRQDMNKRLAELREDMKKHFEQIDKRFEVVQNLMMAIVGAFAAIVAVIIGFAM